jgi:hypothetical protein
VSGGVLVITRFFFKEHLELSEQFGENVDAVSALFSTAIQGFKEVRLYSSYIAVEWKPASPSVIEPITEQVVSIGIKMLSEQFGWSQDPIVEYFEGQHELAALKRREKPGDFDWVLGMG